MWRGSRPKRLCRYEGKACYEGMARYEGMHRYEREAVMREST